MKITPEMIAIALREQNEERSAAEKDKLHIDAEYAKYTYGAWIDLSDLAGRLNLAVSSLKLR